MKKYILPIAGVVIIILGLGYVFRDKIIQKAFEPNDTTTPQAESVNPDGSPKGQPEIVSEDLDTPWEIRFLPDGDMLVTERPGVLKRYGKITSVFNIEGVSESGEGGLLGLALHPDFSKNNLLYLYFTTSNRTNKLVRYKLSNTELTIDRTILENIPGANNHDGGRIAFGPDKKLYISTGDAQIESLAQDPNSLAGKILRINDDGSIPSDNPFKNATYSYGHRNPQGLAWDSTGQLWSSEHGPSGTGSGFDEINKIEAGKNYGWPTIQGDESRAGMEKAAIQSGSETTWAPADIAIYGNTLYFGGLRGQSLYNSLITGTGLNAPTSQFFKTYGRIRALEIHNGYLYFGTSNKDGRGSPKPNDDKIYRMKL